ncbi:MAG: YihY/virulence factor BrkB family protein [Rhodobacterales bacterium]
MSTTRSNAGSEGSKFTRAKEFAKRLWTQVSEDHVGLIAAGVAFYALLALFPAITAMMSIAGLMVQPGEIVDQLQEFSDIVPEQVMTIIIGQASDIAGSRSGGLGLAAVLGIGFAVWSASRGMASLIEGMNVAYGEKETRGFIKLKAVTLVLTLLVVFGVIFGMMATMAVPIILSFVDLGRYGSIVSFAIVWAVLLVFTFGGLSLIYRFGPDHSDTRSYNWMTPGAPVACLFWVMASGGFAFYVGNFGSYNESFGALSGVIVMLLWLWISAFVVLLGAELNSVSARMSQE